MSEWKETRLKEFISVSSGEGLPDSKMKPGQYPVYGGNGITGFHNEFLFSESRLIIGRVGALCGNVHITQKKSWITDNALVVSFLNNNQDVYFWYYILSNLNLREYAFQSAQPVITGGIIDKVRLKIPISISEQHRIAHILTTCDSVIEQTQSAIAKYKAIKQGILHDLFTRGLDANCKLRPSYGNAPELYKESDLGMIPKEWEVKKLKDLLKEGKSITYGIVQPGEYVNSGVFMIRSQDYTNDWNDIDTIMQVHPLIDKPYERSRVFEGDLLITVVGANVGRMAIVPRNLDSANISRSVARISIDFNKANFKFCYYFLNSQVADILFANQVGGAQPVINLRSLDIFNICLPKNMSEQEKITFRLDSISNKIHSEEILLQKYQSIKRGLMGDLLGGGKMVDDDG